ncbi:MAG: radical SAM protein, partial [Gammaproteobacteria bacterium]
LVNLFHQLHSEEIAGYLFSFNPEPGTEMENVERAPIHRFRRIQFVKYLIEEHDLDQKAIEFDEEGSVTYLHAPDVIVETSFDSGVPFMTGGCPDREGDLACNRPYGSYRPGEEYRDYPFKPNNEDLIIIRNQIKLEDIWQNLSQPVV